MGYIPKISNRLDATGSGGGGGGSGITRSINNVSSNTTVGNTPLTDYVYNVTLGAQITMQTAVGNTNRYTIKNKGVINSPIVFTGGQNADGSTTLIVVPNQSLDLTSDNSNWMII